MNATLDHVLVKWESKEHSVEEKLDALEKYIFEHLGFGHEPLYYEDKGSLIARYIAGFIHRYFVLLKDVSFLLLDPIHIFDIITAFAKGIIKHPIRTLKQIWETWTCAYRGGAFGMGALTADAMLAALIAAAGTALAEGEAVSAARAAAKGFVGSVKSNLLFAPNKIMSIGKGITGAFKSYEDFFHILRKNPTGMLADAHKSLQSGVSYGKVYNLKLYSEPFLKAKKAGFG